MINEHVIEAFHMLWDLFPERVRLIHKNRTVIAVNKAAAASGMETGVRCIDAPPKEGHAGCLAHAALKEHTGKWDINPGKTRIRFWVPIVGCEDAYVHYSVPVAGLLDDQA